MNPAVLSAFLVVVFVPVRVFSLGVLVFLIVISVVDVVCVSFFGVVVVLVVVVAVLILVLMVARALVSNRRGALTTC